MGRAARISKSFDRILKAVIICPSEDVESVCKGAHTGYCPGVVQVGNFEPKILFIVVAEVSQRSNVENISLLVTAKGWVNFDSSDSLLAFLRAHEVSFRVIHLESSIFRTPTSLGLEQFRRTQLAAYPFEVGVVADTDGFHNPCLSCLAH